MNDLFNYPARAGSKEKEGTSRDAADEIEDSGKASTLRYAALRLICDTPGGLTADEVAIKLGLSCLSIRPRLSELKAKGKIYKSTARRESPITGKSSAVYRKTL